MANRRKIIETRASKCRYCGGLVNLKLTQVLYNNIDLSRRDDILNYINIILSLPSKNSMTKSDLVKTDHRCYEKNHPLEVKDLPMVRSSLKTYNDKATRVRYIPKVKYKIKTYLDDSILTCPCAKTMNILPTHTIESFSERHGYNLLLSKARQYIVNYILRR